MVKNPPAMSGDPGSISGWGRSLTERMAIHSSVLAWRIPWIEEPGEGWGATVHGIAESDMTEQLTLAYLMFSLGLPRWLSGKEFTCQCRRCRFNCWIGKIPLEKEMATHSSILAWEIPGQRSLMVFSPWCHKRVRHDFMKNNNIQPLLQEINIS